MLTGQRRDEVGGMRRTEVAGNIWPIRAAGTKNHREHVVPLPDFALALIAASPRRTGRDYVFGDGARRKGDSERGFSGWSKAKTALEKRIVESRKSAANNHSSEQNKVKRPPDWRLH